VAAVGWEQSARRFLQMLESLDGVGPDRDAEWIRLAAWTLAAASSVVLYELARQLMRDPRTDDRGFDSLVPPEQGLR
jgi:hypothetical protein